MVVAYFFKFENNIFFSFLSVRLVKVRAEAMQLSSDMTKSGMMTVFLAPNSKLNSACAEARKHCETLGLENIECRVANYLYPECKVIAGNKEVIQLSFLILWYRRHLVLIVL